MKNGNIQHYLSLLAHQPGHSPYLLPDYLTIVHPGWTLFSSGNFLFPLTPRRLAWYRLLEQPLLTQHFALIGEKKPQKVDYDQLLTSLQQQFHQLDFCLDTTGFEPPRGWKSQERLTYRLNLPENPLLLRENYSQHLKRLLKKPASLLLRNNLAVDEFLPFLRTHLPNKTRLPKRFYAQAETLLRHPGLGWQIYGAYANEKLVAACAILHHGNQRYYQLAVNAPAGKNLNAMHQLVDHLLINYCGQGLVFDFEGSMIAGLQRFYSGFGAKPYIYTRVSYSRLPWPLSLWKHGI